MESKLNGIVQNACIVAEADTITRPSRRADEGAPTVIVVEKRPLMRDLLSRCLARTAGFEVLATATVDECIEVAKTHDATVILISVAGDPDGGDTQQILRRATQALGAPIVVLAMGRSCIRSAVFCRQARAAISQRACPSMWRLKPFGSFARVVSTFRRAASLEWEMPIRLGQPQAFNPTCPGYSRRGRLQSSQLFAKAKRTRSLPTS